MSFHWLPETKYRPPAPPADLLARTALLDALCAAISTHRLTLLSAAAGSGKTVMLASLAHCAADIPVAWISLDSEDNDPVRFLLGVVAALRQIEPTFGAASQSIAEGLTTSVGRGEVMRAAGALINDVLKSLPMPFILALDDLHFVTHPLLYEALDYLLEHLPSQMHLAIATRYDPPIALGRLRARRHLAEFRPDALRFGYDEARALIGDGIGAEVLDRLYQQTEGWAAGLVLLTSALRSSSHHDRTTLIDKIARQSQLTFDYLADEVLNQQPPDLRSFLLQTSILHQLTPHTCQAVTGCADAADLLDKLHRRNLFISAVQLDPPIYRYHDLFSEFLQRQLMREHTALAPELHQRAAAAESIPSRVIHHHIAAQAWDAAASIIEQVGEQLVSQGMHVTLTNWLASIPEAAYATHPRLVYLRAACAMIQGDAAGIDAVLHQSIQAYELADDQEHITANLCALGTLAFTQARFDEAERFVHQAMGHPARLDTQVTLLMLQASIALFARDDTHTASRNLHEAVRLVRESTSEEALLMLVMYLGQEFTVVEGGLDLLETFCIETLTRYEQGANPIRLGILDVLAFIHLRRGRLTEAVAAGKEALEIKDALSGFPFLGVNAALTVSNVYLMHKDYEQSERYLKIVSQQLRALPLNAELVNHADFEYGRLNWLRGQHLAAESYSNKMYAHSPRLNFALALRQMLSGLVQLSLQNYAASEESLVNAISDAANAPIALIHGNPQVWLAYLYEQTRAFDQALATFEPLLAECERSNTPGLILQEGWVCVPLLRRAASHSPYARSLLDLLGEPLSTRTQKSVAGLTQREIEVIALIADGASNRAIAEKLFLSQTTVKSHVAHVMNKLGVSSRTEIIAQARRLGLV